MNWRKKADFADQRADIMAQHSDEHLRKLVLSSRSHLISHGTYITKRSKHRARIINTLARDELARREKLRGTDGNRENQEGKTQ